MNYKNVVYTQWEFTQLLRKFKLLNFLESGWDWNEFIGVRFFSKRSNNLLIP